MMLSCVGLLSINGNSKANTDDGVDRRYYAFISIICGLCSPLALSCKHIIIRFFKKGYNTWDMALDGLIFEYLLYAILALYTFVLSNIESQFSFYNLMIGFFASCFLIVGKISIAMAVANGIAGPAASLGSTQAIHATLLTTVVS